MNIITFINNKVEEEEDMSKYVKLRELSQLYKDEVITEEEFKIEKQKILDEKWYYLHWESLLDNKYKPIPEQAKENNENQYKCVGNCCVAKKTIKKQKQV